MALWLRNGAVVAAAGLDAARDVAAAKRLVERRTPVSATRLLDPAADLRALARS